MFCPERGFQFKRYCRCWDLGVWQSGFGSGTAQNQGDSDGDSDVDGADFLAWQRTLGQAPPPTECIDISIDGLSEAVEENPGAIIWRNSDFSKLSLDATQLEAGEPLYVPDYSAPSSLYDPNNANDFTNATVEIDAGMIGNYNVRFTFDNLQIELWTTSTWAGLDAQGGGLSKIQSGFNLVPNSNMISFQIEGLGNSAAFAADFIQVEAIPTGGGAVLEDKGFYTVVDTGIGVDGNRDTEIDFESNYDRQLLFWFNNDQEGTLAPVFANNFISGIEAEDPTITSADNTDGIIGLRRDLEDLAPLRVKVAPVLIQNVFDTGGSGSAAPGELEVTYRLLLENPAGATLRLFYSNNADANAIRHVSDDNTANIQATDPFFRSAAGPSFANQQQLSQIAEGVNSDGVNTFLFEALGAAYGTGFTSTPTLVFETTIEYADGSLTAKRQEIKLDLRDIKKFYTRWDIDYGVNGGTSGTDLRADLSFQHYPTPTTPMHSSQIQNASFLSGDDSVVFVHGWNMDDSTNEDWKAAFSETAFKRLYWQGFRGEFVSFNWPTFVDGDINIFDPLDTSYNPSDYQAYRSANALKEILADLRGEDPNLQPVHLMAHSMGNIVAGEALRQWTFDIPLNDDPLVTTYVAMQAAVSAGAYGSNGTDSIITGRPEPDLYRFWSHGQDDGLTNPSLGTSPYFAGAGFAAEKRVNMYNEDDWALLGWDGNNLVKERAHEFFDFGDPYFPSTQWLWGYLWSEGAGGNTNTDTFNRYTPNGTPEGLLDATLTLTDFAGRPGPDAYEILAFFSQSADTALGTKSISAFDSNINIQTYGLLHGDNLGVNHSYQFSHDAAETWDFFRALKGQMGFGATHNANLVASIEEQLSATDVTDFLPLSIPINTSELRSTTTTRAIAFDEIGRRGIVEYLQPLPLADVGNPLKDLAESLHVHHERNEGMESNSIVRWDVLGFSEFENIGEMSGSV